MNRVRRWVRKIAAGLSLILCLATGGMWLRSYWVSEVCFNDDRFQSAVASGNGKFVMIYYVNQNLRNLTYLRLDGGGHAEELYEMKRPIRASKKSLLGASFYFQQRTDEKIHMRADAEPDAAIAAVMVPYWMLFLSTLALFGLCVWLRPRHAKPGMCRSCGYNLAASLERCPECGKEIAIVK